MLVLLALATAVFGAVYFLHAPKPGAGNSPGIATGIPAAIKANAGFGTWFARWKGIEPYVSTAEFESEGTVPFSLEDAPAGMPAADALAAPLSDRYVWTDDRAKFVDYLFRYPEDEAMTAVYGRHDGTFETMQPCPSGCVVDGAFWTGPTTFVLLGRRPATGRGDLPLCIDAQDGNGTRRCYDRLFAAWFDLETMKRTDYVSSPHVFASRPTGAEKRDRWASGLTPQARVEAGALLASNEEYLNGPIISMSSDGTSFAVDGGRLGPHAVKIIGATKVRDANGGAVQYTYLRPGFSVAVHGQRSDELLLIADEIDVTSVPSVLLIDPKPGATVARTFSVAGSAVHDAWPLTLTVADAAGKTLVTQTAKLPAAAKNDAIHDFTLDLRLPKTGLAPGQKLRLTAAPQAGDGAATLDLIYLP
jgi:hypothetical protein